MALTTYNNTVNQKPSILDSIILQGSDQVPFLQWLGKGKVSAPKHSWFVDRLRDAKENFNLEITDIDENTVDTKQMIDNVTQIVKNEFGLSRKELDNARYGKKEWDYRVGKNAKEHAKDLEYALLGLHNNTVFDDYTPMSETQPAKMAGLFRYIPTTQRQDFKDGDGNATDFTYDKLSEILQPVWEVGGLEDKSFMLIVGTNMKKAINRFAGDNYFRRLKDEGKYDPTLYELDTDFGSVKVKMHRLFNNAKLSDKVLVGKLDEARMMMYTSTEFTEPPTSLTARYGRYYTDFTLEVQKADYFACGEGLK